MLDINTRIVSAGVIDISVGSSQSFTAVNLGRVGLPVDTAFVVHITDVSAQAITPVNWYLEVTKDNGSTWERVAVIEADVVSAKAIFSVPAGLNDIRPEHVAGADIDVRVTATYTNVASADDVTFDAYLAGPQSFASFN